MATMRALEIVFNNRSMFWSRFLRQNLVILSDRGDMYDEGMVYASKNNRPLQKLGRQVKYFILKESLSFSHRSTSSTVNECWNTFALL